MSTSPVGALGPRAHLLLNRHPRGPVQTFKMQAIAGTTLLQPRCPSGRNAVASAARTQQSGLFSLGWWKYGQESRFGARESRWLADYTSPKKYGPDVVAVEPRTSLKESSVVTQAASTEAATVEAPAETPVETEAAAAPAEEAPQQAEEAKSGAAITAVTEDAILFTFDKEKEAPAAAAAAPAEKPAEPVKGASDGESAEGTDDDATEGGKSVVKRAELIIAGLPGPFEGTVFP